VLAGDPGGLMGLRSWLVRLAVLAGLALVVAACAGQRPPAGQAGQPMPTPPKVRYANIGGYLLGYECAGTGRPTVILEAGYTASGVASASPVWPGAGPPVPGPRRHLMVPWDASSSEKAT
jgi:hypothetical protein